ncbi:hypothetical protein [Bacteroides eggerthii]|uniref:hypothetical protein n=1 Tax=Bacteroides eggerthii TaxID=28111 RepID=UPI00189C5580|nr:hypothetical protein [Bacteroides eggerthii]
MLLINSQTDTSIGNSQRNTYDKCCNKSLYPLSCLDYLFYLRCEKGIQSLEWPDKPDNACRINATNCHFTEIHCSMWAIPLFRKRKRNIN